MGLRSGDCNPPLDVFVPSGAQSGGDALLRKHVYPANAPARSLVPLGKGLYAASPELCFVQMGSTLSFVELVQLGYRLCAAYCIDEPTGAIVESDPLVTYVDLTSYVGRCKGMRGFRNAERAMKYVLPMSGSPMESALAMLLVTPRNYGGYGLKGARLNARIDLDPEEARAAGRSYLCCDMLWEKERVVVEYDSRTHHDGSFAFERDSIKRTVLKGRGYDVITVTTAQLFDSVRLEQCAKTLARMLGRKVIEKTGPQKGREVVMRQILLEHQGELSL